PRRTTSGFRPRRWSRFSSEPLEVRKPELDQRSNGFLQTRLARRLERLLVALAHLGRVDALLQPVVARDEQLLDLLASVRPLHKFTVTSQIVTREAAWKPQSTRCRRRSAC